MSAAANDTSVVRLAAAPAEAARTDTTQRRGIQRDPGRDVEQHRG